MTVNDVQDKIVARLVDVKRRVESFLEKPYRHADGTLSPPLPPCRKFNDTQVPLKFRLIVQATPEPRLDTRTVRRQNKHWVLCGILRLTQDKARAYIIPLRACFSPI